MLVTWDSPVMSNGDITGYVVVLVGNDERMVTLRGNETWTQINDLGTIICMYINTLL